ncbi:hypothetical protein JX265_013763 [Neoarthrinium moseri]|uniref:Uncharacterized protein n=1 Tax=Neoarthrinium moseri TaxID=1658444 RepID=A0A9P9W7W8_9PEZI|nr:hypothetical protein JX266_013480 [Neoarthrinium moseri]KAI1848796.1 hypothetical protein JX265_013763 [Neoarthrinium moseri]
MSPVQFARYGRLAGYHGLAQTQDTRKLQENYFIVRFVRGSYIRTRLVQRLKRSDALVNVVAALASSTTEGLQMAKAVVGRSTGSVLRIWVCNTREQLRPGFLVEGSVWILLEDGDPVASVDLGVKASLVLCNIT